MSCSCCKTSIVDGVIGRSEHEAKVYNLQCRFQAYVASTTDKWRYGIFCPEDSDQIVEIRALLRLLTCYGKQTAELAPGTSNLPDAYNEFTAAGGIDLNTVTGGSGNFPAPANEGDYFLITSPYTGKYYILKALEGFYLGAEEITLATVIYQLDQGESIIQFGQPGYPGTYLLLDTIHSGIQSELDAALAAAQGVTVFASGLTDAELLLITAKIEKLLEC